MSDKPVDYGREVRETVIKSTATGVAVTALAVTVFSPAGFGGMIGISLASGVSSSANAIAAESPYAHLPPFPAPLSQSELQSIHSQLARSAASLEITRAATQERIDHIRAIALTERDVTPMYQTAAAVEGLRPTTEPEPFVAAYAPAPAPLELSSTPVSYNGSGAVYSDPNLELAELLLARDNY